jgi:hypothetical protein
MCMANLDNYVVIFLNVLLLYNSGAFLQVTSGLIGMFVLCSFTVACIRGAVGFIFFVFTRFFFLYYVFALY